MENNNNIELIEVLDEQGHWFIMNEPFNWEFVTDVEILNNNYCIIKFHDGINHQYNIYKYKLIWKKN